MYMKWLQSVLDTINLFLYADYTVDNMSVSWRCFELAARYSSSVFSLVHSVFFYCVFGRFLVYFCCFVFLMFLVFFSLYADMCLFFTFIFVRLWQFNFPSGMNLSIYLILMLWFCLYSCHFSWLPGEWHGYCTGASLISIACVMYAWMLVWNKTCERQ